MEISKANNDSLTTIETEMEPQINGQKHENYFIMFLSVKNIKNVKYKNFKNYPCFFPGKLRELLLCHLGKTVYMFHTVRNRVTGVKSQ